MTRLPIFLLLLTVACQDSDAPVARASTRPPAADSIKPPWVPRPIVARPAPRPAATDTTPDSIPLMLKGKNRPFTLSAADSARWPVKGPAPLPGALLPEHRIIAYYGNPRSNRMGILGQIPRDEMLARLERTATEWARADTTRKAMPALHLIATVAQGKPGPGGKYRLRHGDALIEEVASWAEQRGWVVFLDVQVGRSTVANELPHLIPFLKRPYVHLALDPEFAMRPGGVPGRRIGTLDAADLNQAIGVLADIVEKERVPPKVLVVHRFTQRMLTSAGLIRVDPRVQVVIDMDGFGTRNHKQDAYRYFIVPEPVQYTGFKLFYRNDRLPRHRPPDGARPCADSLFLTIGCGDDGLMTPEQVLGLYPEPLYIQYQ